MAKMGRPKGSKKGTTPGVLMHLTLMGRAHPFKRETWSAWVSSDKDSQKLGTLLDRVTDEWEEEGRGPFPLFIDRAIAEAFGAEIRPVCHVPQQIPVIRKECM